MTEFSTLIATYWPLLAGLALFLLVTAVALARRGQRVTLTDDTPPPLARTLARDRPRDTPDTPIAVAAPDPAGDPLTQIKGLGPKVAARLAVLGITRFDQLAALDEASVAAIDAQLGPFAGRIVRDRWVEQAQFLAAGDRAGFEAAFGALSPPGA